MNRRQERKWDEDYVERHAAEILERSRARSLKKHGATGLPSDLDPVEACHRGVCMKCSGKWGPLYLHIPSHYPNVSFEEGLREYRKEFQIPDDVKLAADWHRKKLSQGQSKRMHGPGGEQVRAQIALTLSRPRPDLYGKTGPNPSGKAISSWEIAKRLTRGKGLVETMDELGATNHKLIQRRGAALGLAFDTAFLCDQGEPFRYGSLFHLRRVSGFEAGDFDKCVGLSAGRSFAQPADSILSPQEARKAIEWRDEVVRALLGARALHVAHKDYRKDDVLRTFSPELPEVNKFVVPTIADIRKAVREHREWGAGELCEWICIEAQREQSISASDNRWRKTLRYLWQSEEWICKNLHRLRGEEENDGPLAREMIGSQYGATQQTVQNALRERTEPITPVEIRLLIVTYAPSKAAPKAGRRRGDKDTETKKRTPKAAALLVLGYSQPQMIPFLYPRQHDAEAGRKAVQKFLSRNRAAIERQRSKMTRERAQEIVASRQT